MDHGPAEGIDERTAKDRFSSEEKRALDRMHQDIYQEIRHAAEAHRQVYTYNNGSLSNLFLYIQSMF